NEVGRLAGNLRKRLSGAGGAAESPVGTTDQCRGKRADLLGSLGDLALGLHQGSLSGTLVDDIDDPRLSDDLTLGRNRIVDLEALFPVHRLRGGDPQGGLE